MSSCTETINCELTVIGAGIAGMAAALFASSRNIETVQVGGTGRILFSSGLMDLMGVHPTETGRIWENPWAAIDELTRDMPEHPYALVGKEDIGRAFREMQAFLEEAGLRHETGWNMNSLVVTQMGTVKPTFLVPAAMWKGASAFRDRMPCLIAGFDGLKGFSSHQLCAVLKKKWPELRPVTLGLQGNKYPPEIYPEQVARSFDLPENVERLADLLLPHLGEATGVGLPAVLGIYSSGRAVADLEKALGAAVFEIPSIPPSIPGTRLLEAFTRRLRRNRVRLFHQSRVLEAACRKNGEFILTVGQEKPELTVKTRAVILASGRFLGGGLHADMTGIRETILDLPVHQPDDRELWHRRDFFDPTGHPANRAGLKVDRRFRPIGKSGGPAFENLYAVGSILAHQDWMRMKCGSGLSIATAYGAVKSFVGSRP